MRWLQDHPWVVVAVLALSGLAWWAARRPSATTVPGAAARRQVDLTFAAAVLITLAVGWMAVLWLLDQADKARAEDRAALQAEAIKTGATIALGTGGAAYLLLAYRRQRLDEVDTQERRITELYTKAVEQLGHEKAPVRLGALYSLERLAQNNPEHRQTVVDVFCAYLRMPCSVPAQNEGETQEEGATVPGEGRDSDSFRVLGQDPIQEELQVRQAAQCILAAHLRLSPGVVRTVTQHRPPSPRQAFWPGISLDLSGAVLVNFQFASVSVRTAWFNRVTFHGNAGFDMASFHGKAFFEGATFEHDAQFHRATFHGNAQFDRASFQGDAWFHEATFQGYAVFYGATFKGDAQFPRATLQGDVVFETATFQRDAQFTNATFTSEKGVKGVVGAQVLLLDNPDLNKSRVWPYGCTVRPDPADPTRGTLVLAEQVEEPEPAIPSSDLAGR